MSRPIINIQEAEKSPFPSKARYSDNAAAILKLANQKATIESKGVVGTEDILWATFASSQTTSRSKAVEKLQERGVSFDMIFGKAILSENARTAFAEAIRHAQAENHRVVGSEDLLWALFQKTKNDSKARYWLSSQRIAVTPSSEVLSRRQSKNSANSTAPEQNHSFARLFTIGGLAGTFETLVQQPLVYWKTMSQINPNFNFLEAVHGGMRPLFRGVAINAGSIGPISAVQLTAHGGLEAFAQKVVEPRYLEETWFQLSVASVAGAASCAVVTPAEVLMVTQQTTGLPFAHVLKDMISKSGLVTLYRGNVMTSFREAAWTCGFFGITPILKRELQEDSKFCRRNEVAATAIASIVSGQFAATVSQPSDVIASIMKADTGLYGKGREYSGVIAACKSLYAQSGIQGFFRGLPSRSIRCCGAVFIMGETQTILHSIFDKGNLFT
mmetsp:Transcript_19583/g.36439  ORF Transcript_19583/g.36439 Transcript_19583/m.36439 type:complete len:443 (+) Transcript_19583:281-1609(+)|eukprot:CAMPEP_0182502454 /NCGR_PEP_ID=MMETSP1321-20130603/13393_1 /TAXON_ID=91990 /ORGANISM="Bolidomonas sp., Strain RCC1657" /LENGTH=442 /DNA_ID=CAMNT_0024707361 /DNA_START=217 /DNA_END=1545 /DNA_ORIENTATION=+